MSRTAQALRLALGAGGLVVVVAGASSLVGVPLAALVSIAIFLALGVIAHDGVIAPLTLAGGAAARRLLPRGYLAPLVVATALLGTLSVVALPVLVGINESPDNATVVDRPYRVTWIVLLALAVSAVAVVGASRSGRSRPGPAVLGAEQVTHDAARAERTHRDAGRTLLALSVAAVAAVGAVRPGRSRPGSGPAPPVDPSP